LLAGILVIVGHNWPFYLKFRGGKGVATTIGVGLTVAPICAALAILIGIAIIVKPKYVSLGAISTITIWPFLTIAVKREFDLVLFAFGLLLAAMTIYKHRENINRLLNRNENKIGQKKA